MSTHKAPVYLVGILVGGRGSRMGDRKKGLLRTRELGEPTILTRLDRTITEALGAVPRVLVGRSDGYEAYTFPTVTDEPEDVGPLGGLHAALLYAAQRGASQLIALACDLPYLEAEVLLALAEHSEGAKAVAPQAATGIFEPLIARYNVAESLPAVEAALGSGRYSLQQVLRALACEPLELSLAARASLRDWDTPADMER